MLCVGVCEGVFVSVACCQSVLGSIVKQQVSGRATSGFDGYRSGRAAWRQRKNLFTTDVNSHTARDGFPAEEHDGEPPVRNGFWWWRRQRGGGHPLRSSQSCRDDPRGVWRVPETVGGGEVSNPTGCSRLHSLISPLFHITADLLFKRTRPIMSLSVHSQAVSACWRSGQRF